MSETTKTNGTGISLNRRATLGAGLALSAGLGLVIANASASASAKMLDPNNPADAKIIYRKMRYRSDSGLLFVWIKGPQLAIIGAELTPMYDINFGALQRITQHADGSFTVREMDINFVTDSDTGKRLTTFRNPVTSETVEVKTRMPRPSAVTYTAGNDLIVPLSFEGATFGVKHFPPATFTVGDDVFVRDRTRAHLDAPGKPSRTLNEISIFSAPRQMALDPAVTSVDVSVQSNDLTSWPTWLNMANVVGSLGLYAVGGKAKSFDGMPADWLEMIHEVWPAIAADPIAALDAPLTPG